MQQVGKGMNRVGEMRNAAFEAVIRQQERSPDKRSPGSVTDARFSDAIKDLAGLARESELLGISPPKTDHAPASLGEVIKIVLQRKTAARQKLIPAEGSPGSGVTDPQIQQATGRPSSDKRTGSTSRRFASVRLNLGMLPVASRPEAERDL
jgi:hypothetical protein